MSRAIGIEVTRHVVRAVVLDDDSSIVAADEFSIETPDDHDSVTDALVRLRSALGEHSGATRIAWFPTGSTLQRTEITGSSNVEINGLRQQLDTLHGLAFSMVVDVGPRRWLIASDWNDRTARRLVEQASAAGFEHVDIEPAPLSLQRVLTDSVTAVVRHADDSSTWAMTSDGVLPLAATTLPAHDGSAPLLIAGSPLVVTTDEVQSRPELVAAIADAAMRATDRSRSLALGEALTLGSDVEFDDPPTASMSASGAAVAAGAALGTTRKLGTGRAAESLGGTRPAVDPDRRPWTIETLSTELPETDSGQARGWWQRMSDAIAGLFRR